VLTLAFGMAVPVAKAADTSAATYVRAGKLLDVRSGKMLNDQVIVIRGDRIERFAASGEVQIPAGATTVELTHATVLPGLIDCHTHIMLTDTDDSHYDEILLKQSWQYRTILATLNLKRDLEAWNSILKTALSSRQSVA
jgi:imidazolonepropionase-like amidohydrolase